MPKSTTVIACAFAASVVVACDKKEPVAVVFGDADRAVQHLTVSSGPYHPLDHVVVRFSVLNTGADSAAPVSASIRLSTDATITAADSNIGPSMSIPAIAPGDSSATIAVEVILPESAPVAAQFIGVLVTDDSPERETDLTDNASSTGLTLDSSFIARANRLGMAAAPGYCALSATKAVYCWGINTRWQFGASTPANGSNVPLLTTVPNLDAMSRGGGNDHMCGLIGTSARCWGRAEAGMLGNGVLAPGTFSAPVTVSGGIAWSSITVSQLSACGVSSTGQGYCWGSNQKGEVGSVSISLGGTTSAASTATTPHLIDGGLTFKSVVAGWRHACGIVASGTAYCWGDNSSLELGIGSDTTTQRTPVPVFGGLKFVMLALGARQTCGITTTHDAYCWGTNGTGQLGDGTLTDRGVPTLVLGGLRFAYIATAPGFSDALVVPVTLQGGSAHTCGLTEQGAAYCWGYNGWGQLGDASIAQRLQPVAVSGGFTFNTIATGATSTCGMSGSQIRCWGNNSSSQLGIGSTTDANVPMLLPAPFNTP
jgi:alpha-tubulin suppressor-like RCC1 family protein